MPDSSDISGLVATLAVLVALSGILPIENVKIPGTADAARSWTARSWRRWGVWSWQGPAVLAAIVLVALVLVAAENYFDSAHRLNEALIRSAR
jgi:uncharacterized membrane protein YdfJ with MMPL/SSD domain